MNDSYNYIVSLNLRYLSRTCSGTYEKEDLKQGFYTALLTLKYFLSSIAFFLNVMSLKNCTHFLDLSFPLSAWIFYKYFKK